ncbi:hypothetical protein [Nitratifractor sp.]
MIGEYINAALMLFIVVATIWILKSPKKEKEKSGKDDKSDSVQ